MEKLLQELAAAADNLEIAEAELWGANETGAWDTQYSYDMAMWAFEKAEAAVNAARAQAA